MKLVKFLNPVSLIFIVQLLQDYGLADEAARNAKYQAMDTTKLGEEIQRLKDKLEKTYSKKAEKFGSKKKYTINRQRWLSQNFKYDGYVNEANNNYGSAEYFREYAMRYEAGSFYYNSYMEDMNYWQNQAKEALKNAEAFSAYKKDLKRGFFTASELAFRQTRRKLKKKYTSAMNALQGTTTFTKADESIKNKARSENWQGPTNNNAN